MNEHLHDDDLIGFEYALLAADRRDAVSAHLERCAACTDRLARVRERVDAVAPPAQPPPGESTSLSRRLPPQAPAILLLIGAVASAALVMLEQPLAWLPFAAGASAVLLWHYRSIADADARLRQMESKSWREVLPQDHGEREQIVTGVVLAVSWELRRLVQSVRGTLLASLALVVVGGIAMIVLRDVAPDGVELPEAPLWSVIGIPVAVGIFLAAAGWVAMRLRVVGRRAQTVLGMMAAAMEEGS